jgi:hypothetical protein
MLDLAARSWRTEAWILQQIKAGHSQYAKCGVTSGHEENRVRLDGLSATWQRCTTQSCWDAFTSAWARLGTLLTGRPSRRPLLCEATAYNRRKLPFFGSKQPKSASNGKD